MANLLSSLTGGSGTNQLDSLVNSFRQTLQPRLNTIRTKQSKLENQQRFYTTLNTRLNSVVSNLDKFDKTVNSDIADKFLSKVSTVSDKETISITTKNNANLGNNALKVNRLATTDLLVSDRLNIADNFGIEAGIQSFEIEVNGEKKTYEVTFDGSENNQQAVNKIIAVVNGADDNKINVSLVKDTKDTLRFTLTTKEVGKDNVIKFGNSEVLSKLGFTSDLNTDSEKRVVFDSKKAGFRSSNTNLLDSEVIVDGITVSRSSNTLSDVLPDIEIGLLKIQKTEDNPITVSTSINTEPIEKLIEPLLGAYNELMTFINQDKNLKRNESTVNRIYNNLRKIGSEKIINVREGAPEFITNIGITIDRNGLLKVTNKETLKKVLEKNPDDVTNIFLGDDGFVAKMKSIISSLRDEDGNGVLKNRRDSLQTQIDSTKRHFDSNEKRVESQVSGIRKRYTTILQTFLEAQSKFGSASAVSSSLFGGGGR